MPWHLATVVTQIVADKDDPAFLNPTKPIGSFYSKEEAKKMMEENPALRMKEDAGRGFLQMVASPKPVDRVAVNYGKPDQRELTSITVEEAKSLCREGHFAPGSMLPKVEAAMDFAGSRKGRNAVIASLEKAPLAMIGESGTRIAL